MTILRLLAPLLLGCLLPGADLAVAQQVSQFRAFGRKLNLEIFREFEAEGIQFSLPLRHSYWKRDADQGPLEIQIIGDD